MICIICERNVAARTPVNCTIFSQLQQQLVDATLSPIFVKKLSRKLPNVISLLFVQTLSQFLPSASHCLSGVLIAPFPSLHFRGYLNE